MGNRDWQWCLCPRASNTNRTAVTTGLVVSGFGTVHLPWFHLMDVVDSRATAQQWWPAAADFRTGYRLGVSSYTFNLYLVGGIFAGRGSIEWPQERSSYFFHEAEVEQPALTPILGDGVWSGTIPDWSDHPCSLYYGSTDSCGGGGMSDLCIARHGRRPSSLPATWPVNQRMPGAINVVFFDGHAELVPLEQLWQLYWSHDWKVPAKRPGLP